MTCASALRLLKRQYKKASSATSSTVNLATEKIDSAIWSSYTKCIRYSEGRCLTLVRSSRRGRLCWSVDLDRPQRNNSILKEMGHRFFMSSIFTVPLIVYLPWGILLGLRYSNLNWFQLLHPVAFSLIQLIVTLPSYDYGRRLLYGWISRH